MKRAATIAPGCIRVRLACAVVCALAASGAEAQRVYKCTSGRSVLYSQVPCLEPQIVDVTPPTQVMDRSGGTGRKGSDVQPADPRAMVASALGSPSGVGGKDVDWPVDRQHPDPQARERCDALDARIAQQEAQAAQPGTDAERKAYATLLSENRQRHRRLRC